MPTHDTRELTLRCLRALRAAAPDELIVVDDGSADGSAEAIRAAHPEARVLSLHPARGFSGAANAGLAQATGELLWLVNSDTEVPPGAVEALRAAFAIRPRLGAASPQLVNPDGSLQWTGGRFPSLVWLFGLGSGLPAFLARRRGSAHAAAAARIEWLSGAALAVRADAWREVGALDEGFGFYAQDLDLCWRLAQAGWDVALLGELRVLHLGGATIGRRAGALGAAHPALLYADLARCVGLRRGAAAGRRARCALQAGNALRLIARRALQPFVPADRRARWLSDSQALGEAQRALGRGPLTE